MILDKQKMQLIKNNEYTFTEQEVSEIYRLATKIVSKYFCQSLYFEDLVQEIVTKFFVYSIKKYDPIKNVKISTFAYICLDNLAKMEVRKRKAENRKINNYLLKADDPNAKFHDASVNLLYYGAASDIKTPSEVYEKEIVNETINNFFEDNPILKDYYRNGLNAKQIAEKYNLSTSAIYKKLTKLKKQLIQTLRNDDDFNMQWINYEKYEKIFLYFFICRIFKINFKLFDFTLIKC